MNKFKFSALRQFGSENVGYTSEIESENRVLSETELDEQVGNIHKFIEKSFRKCEERSIEEKAVLVEFSGKRREEVLKAEEAVKLEMEAKQKAQQTMKDAERLSRKLSK